VTVQSPTPDALSGERFFTVSNLLSIFRAFLSLPFAIIMLSGAPGSRWWGAAIMAVAALTDKLDGVFARRLNQVTEWGKILDPLADKIAVITVVVVLLVLKEIPVWFVALVLVRDVVIFGAGMYLKAVHGVVLPSNETGKWAVGIISLTLFLFLVGFVSVVTDVLMAASVIMQALSSYFYAIRFGRVLKTQRKQGSTQ